MDKKEDQFSENEKDSALPADTQQQEAHTPQRTQKLPQADMKRCLNCDVPLTGNYCSNCGQKDLPKRQAIKELVVNFVGSFTSFESKFFKTLIYLLFRPGFLPKEYNKGKRERYYHPARAYVFISFIFFLLLSSLPDDEDVTPSGWETNVVVDSTDREGFKMDTLVFGGRQKYDSIQRTLPLEERDSELVRSIKHRFMAVIDRYNGNPRQFSADLQEEMISDFPKLFFLLLPIFALILKLLYIRRDFYYSEHLVFSIYYYNFFYLAASISMLFALVPWLSWLETLIASWIVLYLFLGMKFLYKQGWWKTFLKFILFITMFAVCVGIGLAIEVVVALLLL